MKYKEVYKLIKDTITKLSFSLTSADDCTNVTVGGKIVQLPVQVPVSSIGSHPKLPTGTVVMTIIDDGTGEIQIISNAGSYMNNITDKDVLIVKGEALYVTLAEVDDRIVFRGFNHMVVLAQDISMVNPGEAVIATQQEQTL